MLSLKLSETALKRLTSRELALVPIPTVSIPVRRDAKYPIDQLPMISRFEESVTYATTGVNRPIVLRILVGLFFVCSFLPSRGA